MIVQDDEMRHQKLHCRWMNSTECYASNTKSKCSHATPLNCGPAARFVPVDITLHRTRTLRDYDSYHAGPSHHRFGLASQGILHVHAQGGCGPPFLLLGATGSGAISRCLHLRHLLYCSECTMADWKHCGVPDLRGSYLSDLNF